MYSTDSIRLTVRPSVKKDKSLEAILHFSHIPSTLFHRLLSLLAVYLKFHKRNMTTMTIMTERV